MLNFETFKRVFPDNLIKKLKSPLVPYAEKINRIKIIRELHQEINAFTYHPSSCHEFLVFNKNKGVIRISPIFQPKDSFLYYFCMKMLEDEIAENRVEGTYGGWRIGNKIRFVEEKEDLVLSDYAFNSSYNPFLWGKNWKDFQRKACLYSNTGEYNCIVKLDIANFYDNVNLQLLEKKLFLVVGKRKLFYVELLLHFLKNWNKTLGGFSTNHIGLPQESISDCSRLLANFYLQDYDVFMKEICDNYGAKYLRYADDQIVYAKNKEDADRILFEASKFLLTHGLNFNANKAMEFKNLTEFNIYWAFEIFELLEDLEDEVKINLAVSKFLDFLDLKVHFRKHSVLKRILNLDFNKLYPEKRHKVLSLIYNKDFLSNSDYWSLSKIYDNLGDGKKKEFLIILDDLTKSVIYNIYHYNLAKFYELHKIEYDKEKLKARIEELKIR